LTLIRFRDLTPSLRLRKLIEPEPEPNMDSSVEVGSSEMAKPRPLDLTHHYSETTKHRLPSQIKQYYKFFQIPGVGNLAGGTRSRTSDSCQCEVSRQDSVEDAERMAS